jgi:protein tyrosine phosphatase (PTP) superfamily phosphohydrolase (DUF442 family)
MCQKTVSWLSASAMALLMFAGCCATPERQSSYPPPPPNAPCNRCANSGPLPPRFTPTPYPSSQPLPPVESAPTYTPPPYTPPPTQGSYAPPSVRLAPPEALAQDQPRPQLPDDGSRFERSQPVNPPPASIPNGSAPLVKNDGEATPRLPVDIPQFVLAKPRLASGLQPFPDGVTWLQSAGYRTVLQIRTPGESDTAAQRVFEKRGLRYLSLEVGPRNLTKEVVNQFNKIVTDEGNLPLFVFDRDSSLAGALWYLHFRTAEGLSHEKALAEAGRLGFRPDQDDNARTMWVAVQNYLRNLNP